MMSFFLFLRAVLGLLAYDALGVRFRFVVLRLFLVFRLAVLILRSKLISFGFAQYFLKLGVKYALVPLVDRIEDGFFLVGSVKLLLDITFFDDYGFFLSRVFSDSITHVHRPPAARRRA